MLCVLAAGCNVGEHLIDLRPGLVRFVKEREPPRGVRRILFGSTLLLCFTVAVEHQAEAHDEIPARERQPCAAVALPADGFVPARTDVGRDEEAGAVAGREAGHQHNHMHSPATKGISFSSSTFDW